jgi:hypothetical protein
LAVPRRINPGAIASIGPGEVILLGRELTFLSLEPLARLAPGRASVNSDGARSVHVV